MSTKRPDWSCFVGSDHEASHSIALAVEQATDGPPGTVVSAPLPYLKIARRDAARARFFGFVVAVDGANV